MGIERKFECNCKNFSFSINVAQDKLSNHLRQVLLAAFLKRNDAADLKSFGPISKTEVLSKIYEDIISKET